MKPRSKPADHRSPPTRTEVTNPYIGPRAFRRDDPLYGREREASELTNRLISERVVLLFAPSGAGKTSLIQAKIVPRLEAEGFQVIGPIRLNAVAPEGVANRYVWSAAIGLLHPADPSDPALRSMSLGEAVDRLEASFRDPATDVAFIFDQVEELVTLNPTDLDGQRDFFIQLGAVLAGDTRWALLSSREDYLGGLDRFARYLPGQLRARYRLDFLRHDDAARAIEQPSRDVGVEFEPDAVSEIIKDLCRVKVQFPGRGTERVPGPYVEPVQLQVVCHRLWKQLEKGSFTSIRLDDVVANQDLVTRALRKFYSDAVTEVAEDARYNEGQLRAWVDAELITTQGFRSQTMTGPDGAPEALLEQLEARYVIRSDLRAGIKWYELAHDRLVEPAQESNDAWRERHLNHWQRAAELWRRGNEDPNYLLRGRDYINARSSIGPRSKALTPTERKFLEQSSRAWRNEHLFQRLGCAMTLLGLIALIEVFAAVVLWLR